MESRKTVLIRPMLVLGHTLEMHKHPVRREAVAEGIVLADDQGEFFGEVDIDNSELFGEPVEVAGRACEQGALTDETRTGRQFAPIDFPHGGFQRVVAMRLEEGRFPLDLFGSHRRVLAICR